MYKWSKKTWGREDKEGDATANIVEGGTSGPKEEGGYITRALAVATPTLNKGATMVDEGTTTKPSKAGSMQEQPPKQAPQEEVGEQE